MPCPTIGFSFTLGVAFLLFFRVVNDYVLIALGLTSCGLQVLSDDLRAIMEFWVMLPTSPRWLWQTIALFYLHFIFPCHAYLDGCIH